MKSINPSVKDFNSPRNLVRVAQSVYKVLTGGVEIANPLSTDLSGIYNQFAPANQSGVMLRIGANGTTEQQYTWPATAGDPLVINHTLLKQPLGFHVTDIDQPAKVYRVNGATLDSNVISLATDTPSCNATVFIF